MIVGGLCFWNTWMGGGSDHVIRRGEGSDVCTWPLN